MKTFFIGIDISKDTLDFAICKDVNNPIDDSFKVDNSIKGISQMIRKCKKSKSLLWFCFEHTGNYGLLLSHQLQAEGLTYSAVPALEIKQSQGMVRGKSDPVDAKRIALYAATHKHKLTPIKFLAKTFLKSNIYLLIVCN
ncbi:MAG: transposase [Bacteroidales bacterium]|nr:transposase [Bacteroidales bacterium]